MERFIYRITPQQRTSTATSSMPNTSSPQITNISTGLTCLIALGKSSVPRWARGSRCVRSVAYAARRLPADVFLPIQPFIRGVSRRPNQRTFHAKACFATFMKPSFTWARSPPGTPSQNGYVWLRIACGWDSLSSQLWVLGGTPEALKGSQTASLVHGPAVSNGSYQGSS